MRFHRYAAAFAMVAALTACDEEGNPAAPDADPITSTCGDDLLDAAAVDLREVTLTTGDGSIDFVVAKFQLGSPPPPTGTAQVGVTIASSDGETSRQIAVKWIDGATPGPFVFELDGAEQTNYTEDNLEVDGSTVTISVPSSAVDDLGEKWEWRAFANSDGEDVDACPGEVGDYDTQVFGD